MKGILSVIAVLLFLSSGSAFSAQILFEFSGRFGDCVGECNDPQLDALRHQEYSGSLRIPSSVIDREPDGQNRPFSNDTLWSYYELSGPQAQLNFDTVGTTFDIANGAPIDTIVSFCEGILCASNQNFVQFTFTGPVYSSALSFGTLPNTNDHSTKIPSVDAYSAFLYRGFSLYTTTGSETISTNQLSPTETEMNISISSVPLPPSIIYLANAGLFLIYRLRAQSQH